MRHNNKAKLDSHQSKKAIFMQPRWQHGQEGELQIRRSWVRIQGLQRVDNLYKNLTGQPRSEGRWAGVIHDPCLLVHAHKNNDEEEIVPWRCHNMLMRWGESMRPSTIGTGRAEVQTDETFGTLSFERKELDKNRHQIWCQTDWQYPIPHVTSNDNM